MSCSDSGGDRTRSLTLRRRTLYPLSYTVSKVYYHILSRLDKSGILPQVGKSDWTSYALSQVDNSSSHPLVDSSLPAAVRMSFLWGVGLAACGRPGPLPTGMNG